MGAEQLPDRRAIEQALRGTGLSRRLAKRFVSVGWPALVSEAQAERDELRAQLDDLREVLDNRGVPPAV